MALISRSCKRGNRVRHLFEKYCVTETITRNANASYLYQSLIIISEISNSGIYILLKDYLIPIKKNRVFDFHYFKFRAPKKSSKSRPFNFRAPAKIRAPLILAEFRVSLTFDWIISIKSKHLH